MPSRLEGAYSGPTECPILAQIQLQRTPVPSLEEVCSDSRGCQVLAPGGEPELDSLL
jgi:hypothetical protein